MAGIEQYRAPLKSPLTVCLWITERCNLSCKYCYAAPGSGATMDTGRLYKLLDELKELEVFDIVFAGGEPFLHPDIFELIEYALESNIHVGVLSNGLLLDEKAGKRLENIVSGRNFILQISLDSVAPEINDKTRGCGKKGINNLKTLIELDIQLQIACVLTTRNIDTAHLLIEVFYPAVKRFHFLNIQRTEKALSNPELLLTEEQAYRFWMRLKEYAKGFPSDLFLPSLRIMLRSYGEEDSNEDTAFHQKATFECESCSAGITHVNIDAEFNVLVCDIAKDYTRMGNVRDRSFREVWNSPEARRIRESPFPACYRIRNSRGEALEDFLKPEYRLL